MLVDALSIKQCFGIYITRAAMEARAVRRRKGLLQDGEAAYREAHARGYDGDRIVLMGASLGTGVAIALGMTHEVAALVLEALFSALDIASAR
jgi:uncharacterized protein